MDEEYVFEPFTNQYFGSWGDFKLFLNKVAKENIEFSEMIEYFENFEKQNYGSFRTESIPKWIEFDSNGNSSMKYFKGQTYEGLIQEMNNDLKK
jgi:hypothetical protein